MFNLLAGVQQTPQCSREQVRVVFHEGEGVRVVFTGEVEVVQVVGALGVEELCEFQVHYAVARLVDEDLFVAELGFGVVLSC